jgi:hypothetical protein
VQREEVTNRLLAISVLGLFEMKNFLYHHRPAAPVSFCVVMPGEGYRSAAPDFFENTRRNAEKQRFPDPNNHISSSVVKESTTRPHRTEQDLGRGADE